MTPAAVGAGAGERFGGVEHEGPQQMVERQQRPHLLLDVGGVAGPQNPRPPIMVCRSA